jgi:polysaccharide pyruvyl transferase WcaK-like protein
VVLDGRHHFLSNKVRDAVTALGRRFEALGMLMIEVPTIHTDWDAEVVANLFGAAEVTICVSFHGAVFSMNGGADTICVFDRDYYRVKFSILTNTVKIDVGIGRANFSLDNRWRGHNC